MKNPTLPNSLVLATALFLTGPVASFADPLATFGESGWSFDAGADARVRQEIMQNIPGNPGGGMQMTKKNGGFVNHMRFRARVWAELKANDYFRLYLRLCDEPRYYVHPWKNTHTWPDEVILDNLFIEGKGLFDGFLDYKIGRQDFMNLYGLGHVFQEGNPGDGSRSIYAEMARFTLHVTEESTIDLFGIYDFDDNPLRWGTDRSKHQMLTGFGAKGEEPEMDDWGYGIVWGSKAWNIPYQVFAMQKNTQEFEINGVEHPWKQREMVGTKWMPRLNEELTLQLEGMGQVGVDDRSSTLSGWCGYSGLNWKKATESWVKPFATVGYLFMSGDDDAADEEGGDQAWDPMWARSVCDSEGMQYGSLYGLGWWSNMHFVKAEAGLNLGKHHRVAVNTGPMFAANQDGLGGGDGYFKGLLSQGRYDFPLYSWERFECWGHVFIEYFNPGDYYESRKPAYFFRWQVEMKF